MRRAHYWKAAGRTSAPAEVVALDTETWHGEMARTPEGERQTWRCGAALAYRIEGGRRTRVDRLRTTNPEKMLPFICSRLNKSRPVWIIGHNLPYDITVSGLWGTLCSERLQVSSCAIGASTFFIRGQLDGSPVTFCDTFNYWKCSLFEAGADCGVPKLAMPGQADDDGAWLDYCERDVEACAAIFDALVGFMRDEDLGPWSATTAGLSFSAFRKRFMSHKILVHDYPATLKLERASYYGGAVDVAFVGRVPVGRVYELDVQSMYPHACRGDLPYRIAGASRRIGPAALKTLGEQYCVTADVTIGTFETTYPVRHGGRVIHATGEYRTALADPELREALRLGHVQHVHRAAWYHRAPVFREYMDWAIAKRREFQGAGCPAKAAICKMLANSLYGKAGQRAIRWEPWGEASLKQIECQNGMPDGELRRHYSRPPKLRRREGCYLMPERGIVLQVRDYWGFTELQVDHGESRDSCPAIAAHVTSEARMLLRDYQRQAGARHWFYSDTDSVWVDSVGLKRLTELGCIETGAPGKLSVRSEHGTLTIHAPKDYETGERRVVKGARKDATWHGENCYEQDMFPGAASMIKVGGAPGVLIGRVRRTLARRIDGAVVGPGGWTSPIVLDRSHPGLKFIDLDSGDPTPYPTP